MAKLRLDFVDFDVRIDTLRGGASNDVNDTLNCQLFDVIARRPAADFDEFIVGDDFQTLNSAVGSLLDPKLDLLLKICKFSPFTLVKGHGRFSVGPYRIAFLHEPQANCLV